jgi:hypothetical protein
MASDSRPIPGDRSPTPLASSIAPLESDGIGGYGVDDEASSPRRKPGVFARKTGPVPPPSHS